MRYEKINLKAKLMHHASYIVHHVPHRASCVMLLILTLLMVAAPAIGADTGEAAIRERLKGVAETGATFAPNPSVPRYAGKIVQGGLAISGLLFFALTIYGGVMYLTAGGNEEQAKKSTKILIRATIGLFIIIFAGAITQFITGYLARSVVDCPSGQQYNSTTEQCVPITGL